MNIYRPPVVDEIITFYGDLLLPKENQSIFQYLSILAEKMFEGLTIQKECIYTQINNYHPNYLGASSTILKNKNLQYSDCQKSIACEFGFTSWQDIEDLSTTGFNINFETGVNALLCGEIEKLEALISASPEILYCQSQFGHKATLLHYTASNGVELWRQQVPENLPKIISFLLQNGVDKNAKMNVYGGKFTTFELLISSDHPKKSGLMEQLKLQF
ncbi:MAG: hypothetical protein P1U56_19510 [Saprospiraceae bacterium]|nr:hypothetical protein [Saprospiraceae bacterium]